MLLQISDERSPGVRRLAAGLWTLPHRSRPLRLAAQPPGDRDLQHVIGRCGRTGFVYPIWGMVAMAASVTSLWLNGFTTVGEMLANGHR
jgi:hypothetical protein